MLFTRSAPSPARGEMQRDSEYGAGWLTYKKQGKFADGMIRRARASDEHSGSTRSQWTRIVAWLLGQMVGQGAVQQVLEGCLCVPLAWLQCLPGQLVGLVAVQQVLVGCPSETSAGAGSCVSTVESIECCAQKTQ